MLKYIVTVDLSRKTGDKKESRAESSTDSRRRDGHDPDNGKGFTEYQEPVRMRKKNGHQEDEE